jgi:hypothetical protein
MGQCYNSELPVGPQGPQGPPGQQGNPGPQGNTGVAGNSGVSAFSTLRDNFQQPQSSNDPNVATTIYLVDARWVAIGSVIYIGYGPAPIAGGYYMVLNKYMNGDVQAVSVYRLNWVLPGVNFVAYPNNVIAGSSVSPTGTIGASGTNGTNGTNGFSAATQVVYSFTQPLVDGNVSFLVYDNRWMGIGQIVYISSITEIAGFFQVLSKNGFPGNIQSTTFKRLDWTIPNVTFAAPGVSIPGVLVEFGGSTVSPSGPKGPTTELAYINDSQWGYYLGTAGNNSKKTSILVNGDMLFENGDVLECETTFQIDSPVTSAPRSFKITVSPNTSILGTTAIEFVIPVSGPLGQITTIHMNYKIQKTGSDIFRSKGECFVSEYNSQLPVFTETVLYSYVCTSTVNRTLNSGTGWNNDQYILVVANDETPAVIAVINHEVKVVKKLI